MKALIIDDEPMIRTILVKMLEMHNVECVEAEDGKTAEEKLSQHKNFDIIFLDLIMPYVSGWEVLEDIDQYLSMYPTKVVLMTGLKLSEEEHKKLEGRVASVLYKPELSMQKMSDLIKEII